MARRVRHRIEHTNNKHSRAVMQNGTIIIRLARRLSKTEEREHIRNLLRRMTRIVLEEEQKIVIHPFRDLLAGAQSATVALATGRRVQFALVPGARTSAVRTSRGWKVSVSLQSRRRSLHRFLWSLLARTELPRIDALVRKINDETFGARIRSVRMCFASSQWGSCSPGGVIMLNAAMLFVEPSVLKYVIVHELAHRRFTDHSPAYWREVAWAMPTYAEKRKALQEYRLPTL